jgi:hypothetical protein
MMAARLACICLCLATLSIPVSFYAVLGALNLMEWWRGAGLSDAEALLALIYGIPAVAAAIVLAGIIYVVATRKR